MCNLLFNTFQNLLWLTWGRVNQLCIWSVSPIIPCQTVWKAFWDFSVFDWASWGHPDTCPEATAALSSGLVMSSCLMDWNGPLFINFFNPRLKHLMTVPWLWFCTATLNEEFETNSEVNLYMQCKCVACPLFNHSMSTAHYWNISDVLSCYLLLLRLLTVKAL